MKEKYLLRKCRHTHRDPKNIRYGISIKNPSDIENIIPKLESYKDENDYHYPYSRLDSTPVLRWLKKQVGKNFNDVYSEYLSKIPTKYRSNPEIIDSIYFYLEANAIKTDDGKYTSIRRSYDNGMILREFYIDENNIVRKTPKRSYKRNKDKPYLKAKYPVSFTFWDPQLKKRVLADTEELLERFEKIQEDEKKRKEKEKTDRYPDPLLSFLKLK